jgi:hypothetical protein
MFGRELTEGVISNYPTTVEELRVLVGEDCILPKDIESVKTSEYIVNDKWVFVEVGRTPMYDAMTEDVRLLSPVKVAGRWMQNYEIFALSPTVIAEKREQFMVDKIKALRAFLLKTMEAKARSLGYGGEGIPGYLSIGNFVGSHVAKYDLEARSYNHWRDVIWDTCTEMQEQVILGVMPIPSEEELLSMMPEFTLLPE